MDEHNQNPAEFERHLTSLLPVLVVFLISIGATYAAWRYENDRIAESAQIQFEKTSENIRSDVFATMKAYAQFLRGGVGLFHASENVSRSDWAKYVADLSFGETYPGIQGISYNPVLRGNTAVRQFQDNIRATDDPNFTVRPLTDLDLAVPILFLEPDTPNNAPAIGFDIYSEPLRQAAINQAIATGQISMTAKIKLVQDNAKPNKEAAVLLMLPVYQSGQMPADASARTDATRGVVVSVFRIFDVMQNVMQRHKSGFGDNIAVTLTDGTLKTNDAILYASHPADAAPIAPRNTYEAQIILFGQIWTMQMASTRTYEEQVRTTSPSIVLAAGLFVSLLLTALAWVQVVRLRDSEVAAVAAKNNEKHVQLLLHEVNHRAKNMLALIRAIARQTASSDPENFANNFAERVESLGASHDLLVANAWQGIIVTDLVTSQLAHFDALFDNRIKMSGPPIKLNAVAAQNIGMALHELSTNASKYGALSVVTGHINIDWRMIEDEDGIKQFTMKWTETGGPSVSVPDRPGFGSIVLGDMIKSNLSATVKTEYAPNGVRWMITCPLSTCIDTALAS